MKNLIYFDTFSKQVTTHSNVSLLKLEATMDGSMAASAFFLQVFDSLTTPAEGEVPLKSYPVSTSAELYKDFKLGELTFASGMYVCISSTEETKTIASGTNRCAMLSVELSGPEEFIATTVVGDLTSGVNTLLVWAEASGPKRLRRLTFLGSLAANRWLKLYAKDTPSVGDLPILQWNINSANGTFKIDFGPFGVDMFQQELDYTQRIGCSLFKENASGAYVGTTGTGTVVIRAEYV